MRHYRKRTREGSTVDIFRRINVRKRRHENNEFGVILEFPKTKIPISTGGVTHLASVVFSLSQEGRAYLKM